MYPYETPFGVIMKINREPVMELSDDAFRLDHEFWSKYSERLCGNWITYDTPVSDIAKFVDQVYIHNNYKGFIGNRRFVRDDDAQKAFSKLRSSQAGMYAWRCDPRSCPPAYRQKTPASQEALIRETDFAFKQAFAFCPYSPEAVFRYINFLLPQGRFDDAITVAETCLKLDPYNPQVAGTIEQLKGFRDQNAARTKALAEMTRLESEAKTNPDNITNLIYLSGAYVQLMQTNRAIELLDTAITNTKINTDEARAASMYYMQLGNIAGFEKSLRRLVVLTPDVPENRYNLASVEAITGRPNDAMADLKLAMELNAKRLVTNPAAMDLSKVALQDPNLNPLRGLPDFEKVLQAH
jgi:tetratricopeptide (TPR) repeat protein